MQKIEEYAVELDLKNVLSKDFSRLEKLSTGCDIYRSFFDITKNVGLLGSLQHEIISISKNTTTSVSELTKILSLKTQLTEVVKKIIYSWLQMSVRLDIHQVLLDIESQNDGSENQSFNFEIINDLNNSSSYLDIYYYIYLLLEKLSSFSTASKNLIFYFGEISEAYFGSSFVTSEVTETEIDTDSQIIEDLKEFGTFILIVKFICVKSGINFDTMIQSMLD